MAAINLAEKRRLEREARLKALDIAREKKNKWWQKPWMSEQEIEQIKPLMINARVFEYGSGGSTAFFGGEAKEYYSLETDRVFYEEVRDRLVLDHVKIFYETNHEKYLNKIKEIGGQFDVVLVDNDEIPRARCALCSFDCVKEDGALFIHDSAWTDHESPNDRSPKLKEEFLPVLEKYTLHNITQSLSLFKKNQMK